MSAERWAVTLGLVVLVLGSSVAGFARARGQRSAEVAEVARAEVARAEPVRTVPYPIVAPGVVATMAVAEPRGPLPELDPPTIVLDAAPSPIGVPEVTTTATSLVAASLVPTTVRVEYPAAVAELARTEPERLAVMLGAPEARLATPTTLGPVAVRLTDCGLVHPNALPDCQRQNRREMVGAMTAAELCATVRGEVGNRENAQQELRRRGIGSGSCR